MLPYKIFKYLQSCDESKQRSIIKCLIEKEIADFKKMSVSNGEVGQEAKKFMDSLNKDDLGTFEYYLDNLIQLNEFWARLDEEIDNLSIVKRIVESYQINLITLLTKV